MKVWADASSIILLAKATLLKIACENTKIMMTGTTYHEATKKESKEDAKMITNLKKRDRIHVVENPNNTEKFSDEYNLGMGEASVITAAGSNDGIVLTDDLRGLKAARANNIDRATAITALVSMVEEEIVDKDKASDSLQILEREGRYDTYIIDDGRKRIERGEREE